ncbi:MAG TPA: type II toxin-antitoxin system VapC family toxin [Kiritimatiellia bacterium]|nr:type II toxin-antitoxin system VapC family toxin [Kiritimatiellia bacterium]
MDFLVDATLLIDLWREQRNPGPATRFALEHHDQTAAMPWMVMGEFLRGAYVAGVPREKFQEFLDAYILVWPSLETVDRYARLYADMKTSGRVIGPNDLWIAASALEHNLPLVTRNGRDFDGIPDLVVWRYRE